jgi:ABC-2 type transport system permease protein
LPALLAFFLAQYALVAPEAPAVVAFSFVPFVSPLLMFTRVAVANVPTWQLSLAFAIDIVAVVLCFAVAGRVYRIGMLLSGNLPSPAQIWAAIRT